MPERIQLRRTKGWRKPDGAVVVSRPSIFGNPFHFRDAIEAGYVVHSVDEAKRLAVDAFRDWLDGRGNWWTGPDSERRRKKILDSLPSLRGKSLCCWCPIGSPCHADVLLEMANKEPHA